MAAGKTILIANKFAIPIICVLKFFNIEREQNASTIRQPTDRICHVKFNDHELN